jgi:hypothetical protein
MIISSSCCVYESETDIGLIRRSGGLDISARTALTSASATNATTHDVDSMLKGICSTRSGLSSRPRIARVRRRPLRIGILRQRAIVQVK